MKRVLIVIDDNLLQRVDEHIQNSGSYGTNRSAFVREAIEYYLTYRRGISNIIRKRAINNESLSHNKNRL